MAKTGFDTNGLSWRYSFYGQDSFKLSPKLTLEYGPTDPQSRQVTAPGFLASINACPGAAASFGTPCTPFLTATEAGYPENLRFPDRDNFNPRLGFAWRPFNDTKTSIRGGFGMYTMTVLGNIFYSLTGIHGSDIREFNNSLTSGQLAYRWPQVSTGGTGVGTPIYGNAYFGTAVEPTFRDPYMMQYSLSIERDLGWNTGLRVSYIGNRSVQLPWSPDLNQPAVATKAYASRPLTDRPFSYWGRIYSRDSGASGVYNSMQTEFSKRYGQGLVFNTAWTWAKNLSDAGGRSNDFAADNGGGRDAIRSTGVRTAPMSARRGGIVGLVRRYTSCRSGAASSC